MVDFRGAHFEAQIILFCVRWYVAYPLSYRHLEEMMQERGVSVDHSTINRWVIKYSPQLEQAMRGHKRPIGKSWHLDETYVKVKGEWMYLYRAVDGAGQTVDFLLTSRRDHRAARRFLQRAIRSCGVPEKMTIDQSRANKAAIESYNAEQDTGIGICQAKYLNNQIEQDHRAIKRITRPMPGFKWFRAARRTLAGIKLMHMIRKEQPTKDGGQGQTAAE
jgi:putative transposase